MLSDYPADDELALLIVVGCWIGPTHSNSLNSSIVIPASRTMAAMV